MDLWIVSLATLLVTVAAGCVVILGLVGRELWRMRKVTPTVAVSLVEESAAATGVAEVRLLSSGVPPEALEADFGIVSAKQELPREATERIVGGLRGGARAERRPWLDEMRKVKRELLSTLKQEAGQVGANAVLDVRVGSDMVMKDGAHLVLSAQGRAVRLLPKSLATLPDTARILEEAETPTGGL